MVLVSNDLRDDLVPIERLSDPPSSRCLKNLLDKTRSSVNSHIQLIFHPAYSTYSESEIKPGSADLRSVSTHSRATPAGAKMFI
jgi:hypothetical protein